MKRFAIKVVSLTMYVKGAHFYVVVCVLWLGVMVGCLGVAALCAWSGNLLFSMISWIVSSSLYSSFCRWYVFSCYIGTLWLRACVRVGGLKNMG